ncbi:MAG: hypothetical protein HC875_07145 [Anaerolineales bacterium]|nr:hypothetical protein [Anaerolineales bacterium]
MKVLVTYASKYGSTAEIAEVIGKELTKREYEVEVKPIAKAGSLDEYDGFVIGSALYAGGWLKEAAKFLRSHQDLLVGRRSGCFQADPPARATRTKL